MPLVTNSGLAKRATVITAVRQRRMRREVCFMKQVAISFRRPNRRAHGVIEGLLLCGLLLLVTSPARAVLVSLSGDTYISDGSTHSNYGAASTLKVGGPNPTVSTFLKFDLAPLPSGTTGN